MSSINPLNRSNSDKFEIVFSNIPVPQSRETIISMSYFDNFVRSVTLPDYNVEVIESSFMNQVRKNPISRANEELTQINVEFVLDEDFENYQTLYEWMREIRCGRPTKGKDNLHKSVIDGIDVIIKDNENRPRTVLKYKNAMLINITAISLIFGSSEQQIFTCTFVYEDWTVERKTTIANN